MNKWGCPDWGDAAAYPSCPEKLGDGQWRWEFLRRLPKYRRIWKKHLKRKPDKEVFSLIIVPDADQAILQLEFGLSILTDPANTTIPNGEFPNFIPEGRVVQHSDLANTQVMTESENWYYVIQEYKLNYRLEKLGILHVRFNVNKSLDAQFDQARIELKKAKEQFCIHTEQFKNRRDAWVRHLRVIDAKNQGATHSEIANQFVDEGFVKQSTPYKNIGTKSTRNARHKAIVSQWHKQAKDVMEKASRLL